LVGKTKHHDEYFPYARMEYTRGLYMPLLLVMQWGAMGKPSHYG